MSLFLNQISDRNLCHAEATEEDWERIMKVNALSVFLAFKIAGQHMIKQGSGGRLIGVSLVFPDV